MLSDRKVVSSNPASASLVPDVRLLDVRPRASQSSQPNARETVCVACGSEASGRYSMVSTTLWNCGKRHAPYSAI